jgi:hypothetical protein
MIHYLICTVHCDNVTPSSWATANNCRRKNCPRMDTNRNSVLVFDLCSLWPCRLAGFCCVGAERLCYTGWSFWVQIKVKFKYELLTFVCQYLAHIACRRRRHLSEPSGGTTHFTWRGQSFPRAVQRLLRVLWCIAFEVTDVGGTSLVFLNYTARTGGCRGLVWGNRICLKRRGKMEDMKVERY